MLSRVKLIAEPWDVGVARLAHRPVPAAVRRVERPLPRRRAHVLAARRRPARRTASPATACASWRTRLAGSQDLFGARDRGPIASVNYVAAHDGFTLADTTAYDHKHNGANGEGNRDGHDDNRSWNHGVEGAHADEDVLRARRRSVRNLLGTLLLATGVPMLNAGDELGRTQRGNNNAYCQDNEVSWLDWDLDEQRADLLATTRYLTGAAGRPPGPAPPLPSSPAARSRRRGGGRPAVVRRRRPGDDQRPLGRPAHAAPLPCTSTASAQEATSLLLVLHGDAVDAIGDAAGPRLGRRRSSCSGTAPTSGPSTGASPVSPRDHAPG